MGAGDWIQLANLGAGLFASKKAGDRAEEVDAAMVMEAHLVGLEALVEGDGADGGRDGGGEAVGEAGGEAEERGVGVGEGAPGLG